MHYKYLLFLFTEQHWIVLGVVKQLPGTNILLKVQYKQLNNY